MGERKVTLGSEVRRLRELAGLSQEKLAEKLGLTREAVSKIERDRLKSRPHDGTLEGLERHLDLSRQRANELLGSVPPLDGDVEAAFDRISAIEDDEERWLAWQHLPERIRRGMALYTDDLLRRARRVGLAVVEHTDVPH